MDAFRTATEASHFYAPRIHHSNLNPPPIDNTEMPCLGLKPRQVAADMAAMTEVAPLSNNLSNAPTGLKPEPYSQASSLAADQLPELTPDHEDQDQNPASPLFIKQSPSSSSPVGKAFHQETLSTSTTPAAIFSTGSREEPIEIDDNYISPTPAPPFPPRGRKGRSLGENSTKHIRELRAQAEGGSIDAALKLGWSVERLTILFNQAKTRRGILVAPNQPIDDLQLLARIEQRKENGREASKRRAHKLKARAAEGDIEAAKKLKLSDKTMSAMFPSLTDAAPLSSDAQYKPEESPTEPPDFHQEAVYPREREIARSRESKMAGFAAVEMQKQQFAGPSQQPRAVAGGSSAYPSFANSAMQPLAPAAQGGQMSQNHVTTLQTRNSTWGALQSNAQMYAVPPTAGSIEKEIQLRTACNEWKQMAAMAYQKALQYETSLMQHQTLMKKNNNAGVTCIDAVQHFRMSPRAYQRRKQEYTWVYETGTDAGETDD